MYIYNDFKDLNLPTLKHIKALNYAVNVLKENDIVDLIWLYGSCAKNKAKYNSDIDLLIESKINEEITTNIILDIAKSVISNDYSLPYVDAKIIKYNSFEDNSFFRNFVKDRILIFKRFMCIYRKL